ARGGWRAAEGVCGGYAQIWAWQQRDSEGRGKKTGWWQARHRLSNQYSPVAQNLSSCESRNTLAPPPALVHETIPLAARHGDPPAGRGDRLVVYRQPDGPGRFHV